MNNVDVKSQGRKIPLITPQRIISKDQALQPAHPKIKKNGETSESNNPALNGHATVLDTKSSENPKSNLPPLRKPRLVTEINTLPKENLYKKYLLEPTDQNSKATLQNIVPKFNQHTSEDNDKEPAQVIKSVISSEFSDNHSAYNKHFLEDEFVYNNKIGNDRLNDLFDQLNPTHKKSNHSVQVSKFNLNKLKSVSSPSLFHCQDVNDDVNDIDTTHKIKTSHIRKGKLFQPAFQRPAKSKRGVKCVSLYEDNQKSSANHRKRSSTETRFKQSPLEEFSELLIEHEITWFDHVLVVTLKKGDDATLVPYISFQFPPQIDEAASLSKIERINSIPQFCFPDSGLASSFKKSETFSFVLTNEIGGRVFGYCRMIQGSTEKYPEVYCIVSPHGLFALYSQVLDEVEKQRVYSSSAVFSFLKAVISHPLPKPTESLTVSYFSPGGTGRKSLKLSRPGDSAIHEHIIHLVGCLLIELKIVLVSASLSLLSSCCHGFISLMYPFEWEHTYIPVLPTKLVEIVCLPSPYLLGVLPSAVVQIDDLPVEEVIVVDLDAKMILREACHQNIFPKQIIQAITETMDEVQKVSNDVLSSNETKNQMRNKIMTEVFVESYIHLIGHFEDFYTCNEDGLETISRKPFYKASRTKEQQRFLKLFAATQAFQQFSSKRKKHGPSHGLFEECFAEWKKKRKNGSYESKFKDLLSIFKFKVKAN